MEAIAISPDDGTVSTNFLDIPLGGPGKSPDVRGDGWHHIAVTAATMSDASVTFYVDGHSVDSAASAVGWAAGVRPDAQLGAGRNPGGDRAFFTGPLDDFRMYSRVLSPQEIAAQAS